MKEYTEEEIKAFNERAEEEFKEQLAEMLHNQFPRFLKDFLNEFVKTKFFQKPYKSRKEHAECYEYKVEDYFLVDWECPTLSSWNRHSDDELLKALLVVGKFGEIPHYQHDELKAIVIDFENKKAHLEIGFATEPYASKVVKHNKEIPKYMQPLLEQLWIGYEEYKRGNK